MKEMLFCALTEASALGAFALKARLECLVSEAAVFRFKGVVWHADTNLVGGRIERVEMVGWIKWDV
jgi:hypothetical protein